MSETAIARVSRGESLTINVSISHCVTSEIETRQIVGNAKTLCRQIIRDKLLN
ncbi:hypothetical protein CKA32_003853 [Geitlerinema sp. FC II]|nr:hypothetical protein CKA32_003853 [Geitlerinema sp. FC II]